MKVRDGIESVTCLIEAASACPNEAVWRPSVTALLDVLHPALRDVVAGDAPLHADERDRLERCWTCLQPRGAAFPFRDVLKRYYQTAYPVQAPVETDGADRYDYLDVDRTVRNVCRYFASAMAAAAARAAAGAPGDPQPLDDLGRWIARAAQVNADPSRTIHADWPGGISAERLVDLAHAEAAPFPVTTTALWWTRWWLDSESLPARRRRTIPIVSVEGRKGAVHTLQLSMLTANGAGLIEHPTLWNQPLGAAFVATVEDACRATWDAPRPSILWRLQTDAQHGRAPLFGRSHGLALHVGARLLRDDQTYDSDIVFSAAVDDGQLRSVQGLADKLAAARAAQFRRFGYWAGEETPAPLDGVRLVPLQSVDDAVRAATLDPIVRSYLDWVAHQHGRLQLWGIPHVGPSPSVDLDNVYVALRGIETTPAEMKATLAVALREFERRRQSAADDAGPIDEIDERVVSVAPLAYQFAEIERDDRSRKPSLADGSQTTETNLAEAFVHQPVLVILGDPGSGKTTLLRWLARHHADAVGRQLHVSAARPQLVVPRRQVDPTQPDDRSACNLGTARVPILIRASQFVEALREARAVREPPTLWEVLGQPRWDKTSPFDPHGGKTALEREALAGRLHAAITERRAVILIDGLDEVTSFQDRRELMTAIRDFAEQHVLSAGPDSDIAGNKLVITSRIAGYYAAPVPPEVAPNLFIIRPMNRIAVEHFCRSWHVEVHRQKARHRADGEDLQEIAQAESAALIAAIYDPEFPSRAALAGSPLLLTVMASTYHLQQSLPARRPALFQLTVGFLVDAWQAAERVPEGAITHEETWAVLEALAAEIHEKCPTNLLPQTEAERIVARTLEASHRPRGEVARLVADFFLNARTSVGLFVEVSNRYWRFVHQNIQEYLAARHLTRIPSELVGQLLRRMDNPRWREPSLLALGIASNSPAISEPEYAGMLTSFLATEDPLARILPRGPLLLVDAFADLEVVPDWLGQKIAEQLLAAYADRSGMGRFGPLRRRIEAAFGTLRKHWHELEAFLEEHLRAAATACAVAQLIHALDYFTPALVRALYDARIHDSAENDWLIERTLQALAQSTNPPQLPPASTSVPEPERRPESTLPPQLEFRRWIKHATSQRGLNVAEFLEQHPAWLRLICGLYGGLGDFGVPGLIAEYFPFVRLLEFGGVVPTPKGSPDRFRQHDHGPAFQEIIDRHGNDPVMQVAMYLDRFGKPRLRFWDLPPRFQADHVYRDAASDDLTADVIQALDAAVRYPADADTLLESLGASLLQRCRDVGQTPAVRGEALATLLLLGPTACPDWAAVCADAEGQPDTRDALLRLRSMLSDAVVRSAKLVMTQIEPLLPQLREDVAIDVVSAILELGIRHGSTPLSTARTDAARQCGPKLRGYLLGEAWAHWLSGGADDIRYSAAVVLDTIGKRFQESPELLIGAAGNLPISRNLRWSHHLGWVVEGVPPRSDDPLDQLVFALDAVAAIPDELEFVRFWALTDVLRPFIMDRYPELMAEWHAILLAIPFVASFDQVEGFWPTIPDRRYWIEQQVAGINDASLKARAYLRLAFLFPIHQANYAALARAEAEKIPVGSLRRVLALERLIPIAADADSPLASARAEADRLDSDNKARALTRLARHARTLADVEALLCDAATAASNIADEMQRTETLRLLHQEWRHYGDTAAAAFQVPQGATDPFCAWRLLGIFHAILVALRGAPVQAALDGPSWAVLEMAALIEDVLGDDRLAHGDDVWRRLAQQDSQALGRLRALAAFDEVPLTWPAAFAVDQLVSVGALAPVIESLRLVRDPVAVVLPLVDRWSRHADATLRQYSALLLAEAGLLRPDMVDALVACLCDAHDRIRYRAARVCHYQRNARHVRALGPEVMEAIARKSNDLARTNPGVGLALSWLLNQTTHNDPDSLMRWLDQAAADRVQRDAALTLLRSICRATPPVVERLIAELPARPVDVQNAMFYGLISLLERGVLSAPQRTTLRPLLHAMARSAAEKVRLLAVRAIGRQFPEESDGRLLEDLATDAEQPLSIRALALAERGRLWAQQIDFLLKPPVADPKNPPPPPTLEEIHALAAALTDYWQRLPSMYPPDDRSATSFETCTCMDHAAAESLAHIYQAWKRHPVVADLSVDLPRTPGDLVRQSGCDVENVLWAILRTQRFTSFWGGSVKGMVTEAVDLVSRFDEALMEPLVRRLARELDGPADRGRDYWLMLLLNVTAEMARQKPGQLADAAQRHPFLADRLAAAAVRHDAFPGRYGAITLLGFLRQPLRGSVTKAITARFRDVWLVQQGALDAAERISELSDDLFRALLRELTGPSAIAASTAVRMLVNFANSDGARAEVKKEILLQLAQAAAASTAEREVFRIDENNDIDRWCVHHVGRLRDLMYAGMMSIAGL